MRFAALAERDWDAVTEEDAVLWRCGDTVARGEDADEVERVGGADRDQLACLGLAARFAKGGDRFGEGVLLTGEAGDEAATADQALCFQPSVHAEQRVPRWQVAFAIEDAAEDDAPAVEEGPGDTLDVVVFRGFR